MTTRTKNEAEIEKIMENFRKTVRENDKIFEQAGIKTTASNTTTQQRRR